MTRFYIWTIGCQMNKADSNDLSARLARLGHHEVDTAEEADIVVVNSCVVRQSAEVKVRNKLSNLRGLKRKRPETTIVLTGCLVDSNEDSLRLSFPHVDFFAKPGAFDEVLAEIGETTASVQHHTDLRPPDFLPTAYVPIIRGCNNFCSYCIVPYRRGREESRPVAEIFAEVEQLVEKGVKEVTLLGQNVDSYGHDLPGAPDLAGLLREIDGIDGLARIRFLTSHPKDMSPHLIEAIASLEKVCEHISLPAQAGDNEILKTMRRGYTVEQYKDLIRRIRSTVPGVALSTDIIIGFPGETQAQFERTFDLLAESRFDTVHVAAYSPRSGTTAARDLADDVPTEEKRERLQRVEELQERVSLEINSQLVGQTVEVLVEDKKGGRWQGRTRTDKLVFFTAPPPADYRGRLVNVSIRSAGPWSLRGVPA